MKIEKTPDGRVVNSNLERSLGKKQNKTKGNRIKKTHRSLMCESTKLTEPKQKG